MLEGNNQDFLLKWKQKLLRRIVNESLQLVMPTSLLLLITIARSVFFQPMHNYCSYTEISFRYISHLATVLMRIMHTLLRSGKKIGERLDVG